ncbi:hypothetical protein [Microcoleus sp. MOSTC5]|uniref:hypothetical protein n=1 Tax=Microcoleus sp. MOSTC5 TaxID=3055378 RepID=UPI002FD6E176
MQGKSFAEKYIIGGDFGCGFVGFIVQPRYRFKFVQEADMQVAENGNYIKMGLYCQAVTTCNTISEIIQEGVNV